MTKEYGIGNAEIQRIMDQYVLKQGETMDVERLREGLVVLIRENNEALINDIKELIKEK
ncbi:hypothetical protein JOD43_000624 [Pullulanibacillus pueri]|uniref:Uncharacterized protein n=1 Tax=Pullulanibacillus pueri TaxID=1437324 RepID=A0A8J2ZSM0_9BACL|nr:hypothetical protein [Pullulanibacillus pueri]MBM7680465.1 hypothetical protein [Pullulanibacillus pueri]GGH74955.1 hypothetical protein GCM10007096_03670 [Pullulanibacillus pueri]